MRCNNCGENLVESMREENTFAYRAEGLWCHGCRAIHREENTMSGRKEENPLAGTRFRITRLSNGDRP